jgi:DNA helicase-2/ATP-dependent DNA helicase PcrA
LLRANIPVKIQGKDFGGELESLVLKLARGDSDRASALELSLVDLEERLEKFHSMESEKLGKRRNPEMALEILEDKVTCIRLLGEGLRTVGDLCQRIKTLFEEVCSNSGAKRQFVLLSSVHRAKGLEADGVFILQPWLMPHPRATTAEDQEQERNIKFVALTRSKNRLVLEYRDE